MARIVPAQLTRADWDTEPAPPALRLTESFLVSRYGQRQIDRVQPLKAPTRLSEVIELRHRPVDHSTVLAFERTVPAIDVLLCVRSLRAASSSRSDLDVPPMTADVKALLANEVTLHREARKMATTALDDPDGFDIDEDVPPIVHRPTGPATPPLCPRIWAAPLIEPVKLAPIAIEESGMLRLPPDATIREWGAFFHLECS